jgi:glycine cleavage system H lipoate-binding protein
MKWILTTGQEIVISKGYGDLFYNEQLAQVAKLDEPEKLAQLQVNKANNLMSVLLLILAIIVFGGALVELAFVRFTRKASARNKSVVTPTGVFDENTVAVPLGIYFDKSHSWAFMRKNGLVKVGVDDFLQHITGIITRVEMRSVGEKIRKGDRLLSINQKGKQIHIYSPVSGTIAEVNEKLKTASSLINTDPYSEGWVYSIEPLNWNLELRYLEIAENFKVGLAEEFQRLKEFFASALKPGSPDVAHAILQDGGSLVDHPLTELGPDIWDDFQTKFIDASK